MTNGRTDSAWQGHRLRGSLSQVRGGRLALGPRGQKFSSGTQSGMRTGLSVVWGSRCPQLCAPHNPHPETPKLAFSVSQNICLGKAALHTHWVSLRVPKLRNGPAWSLLLYSWANCLRLDSIPIMWSRSLTFQSLSFLICNMGIMISAPRVQCISTVTMPLACQGQRSHGPLVTTPRSSGELLIS